MSPSTSQHPYLSSTSFNVADLPALPSRPQADTSHDTLFARCVLDFPQLHCELGTLVWRMSSMKCGEGAIETSTVVMPNIPLHKQVLWECRKALRCIREQ